MSTVGALVVGEAAVRAAIIGPIMLVVPGMAATSTFAVPGRRWREPGPGCGPGRVRKLEHYARYTKPSFTDLKKAVARQAWE